MEFYRELSSQVSKIYEEFSIFAQFQQSSGLSCLKGCGECCLSPEVTAAPIEMLPLAFHLIDSNQTEWIEKIFTSELPPTCLFYQFDSPDGKQGHCTVYFQRPVLCRIFAASIIKNKKGEPGLSLCKKIKESTKTHLSNIDLTTAPHVGPISMKVRTLYPPWSTPLYPINEALKIVLSTLLYLNEFQISAVGIINSKDL